MQKRDNPCTPGAGRPAGRRPTCRRSVQLKREVQAAGAGALFLID